MRRLIPLLLLTSVACTPQNVQITSGTWTAFLPVTSSQTLFDGGIDLSKADKHWTIDCRNLANGEAQLPGAEDICTGFDPQHESWLTHDGYQVISGDLNPWRAEAVLTSEGDLQLGFHQALPGSADLRFAFVVDPTFEPKRCTEDGNGGVQLVDVDGAPWLDEWSKDVDSGTLYFLNSGAYQFDPNDTTQVWTVPEEWRAGYAAGRLGGDDLSMRRVRYGLPSAYSSFESEDTTLSAASLFYVPLDAGTDPSASSAYQSMVSQVDDVASQTADELSTVGVDFTPMVETNEWRPVDGLPPGLDSWVELDYAWVRFDSDADMTVGGHVSGDFTIVFDGTDSQTRVFVTGSFDVPRIKKDRWVTKDVVAAKLKENNTTLCGVGPDQATQ